MARLHHCKHVVECRPSWHRETRQTFWFRTKPKTVAVTFWFSAVKEVVLPKRGRWWRGVAWLVADVRVRQMGWVPGYHLSATGRFLDASSLIRTSRTAFSPFGFSKSQAFLQRTHVRAVCEWAWGVAHEKVRRRTNAWAMATPRFAPKALPLDTRYSLATLSN